MACRGICGEERNSDDEFFPVANKRVPSTSHKSSVHTAGNVSSFTRSNSKNMLSGKMLNSPSKPETIKESLIQKHLEVKKDLSKIMNKIDESFIPTYLESEKETLCLDTNLSISKDGSELISREPSLEMDEDFDIDRFTSSIREKASNTLRKSMSATMEDSGVNMELSDDAFLDQFPKINIHEDIEEKKNSKPRKSNPMGNISDYVIKTTDVLQKAVASSPPIANYAATPRTSGMHRISNNVPLKRRILVDSDRENRSPKRMKIRTSNTYSPIKNPLSVSQIGDFFMPGNEDYDSEDTENSDYHNCIKNEKYENMKYAADGCGYDMTLSRLGENINFDVNAIPRTPGIHVQVGDKGWAEFNRQKSLTYECINHLFESLQKVPKDGVEKDPKGLTVDLMPHQRQSLKWMKWREEQKPCGGILADDMGLGKTLQMISLILVSKNEKREKERAEGKESDDDVWDYDVSSSREIHEGRTIVICPLSLVDQWEREIKLKVKSNLLSVYKYHGKLNTVISERRLARFDVVITTYATVTKEYDLHVTRKKNKDSRIFKIHWDRIILDEAHYIRNWKTKGSEAVCDLVGKKKWALTGTPIQNKESDLFALLKYLQCSPFDELPIWQKWVSNSSSSGNKRLIVITSTLMLRRTKDELMTQNAIQKLPNREFDLITVSLDQEEKLVYQKLLLYSQTFFLEFLRQRKEKEHLRVFGCHARTNTLLGKEVPEKFSRAFKLLMKNHRQLDGRTIQPGMILVLILRLRQMCCHPALIKSMLDREDIYQRIELDGMDQNSNMNDEIVQELDKLLTDDDDEDDYHIDDNMARNLMSSRNTVFQNERKSSKVRAVLKTIESIVDRDEKAIVVSQWTSFLEVIGRHLKSIPHAKYATFSGSTPAKERLVLVDRINNPGDSLNVLLLSLTAGGVGLNLVGANHILLLDLHWNPQWESQVQDRIYRFGQQNNVYIHKFLVKETIEEKIKQLQDKKLQISDNILNGKVSNRLTIEDLTLLFS